MLGVNIAQPDVTLLLDTDGVITEASVSNAIAGETVNSWVGRPWFETVGELGGDRVRRMVEDARTSGISAFGQVTQRFPSGLELPIEYTTVRLAGRPGLMAVGKNLQAVAELQSRLIATQQAREQEYWKLREVETRYRLLFDASNEAVVLVRAETLSIAELNLAAIRGLGLAPDRDFMAELDPEDREPLTSMLARVREQGRAPGILVHMGGERRAWSVRASLLTSEPGSAYLLQLARVGSSPVALIGSDALPTGDLLNRLPDAFVVMDRDGVIRRANQAFLDLVQLSVEASVIGERLGRWLSHPGSDVSVLLANVQRHRSVRLFTTTIQGELGTDVDVEIAAVGDADSKPKHFAVMLRDVSRRMPRAPDTNRFAALAGVLPEQLGAASMLTVVKNTVAIVEQNYIVAALEAAGGNRTAAAELLGLSRQSLHAKLNRYGLDSGAPTTEAEIE